MRHLIIIVLFTLTSIQAWTQLACSGPLNIDVEGTSTGIPLEIQYVASDIYCLGSAEGTIELIIAGGTPEYTCKWSNGAETEDLTDLIPGMYSVTVTDAGGCAAVLDITVTEMVPLTDQLTLAEYTGCGTCYISDGQSTYIYQDDDYMLHVRDIEDGISLKNIEVCTNVNDEPYFMPDDVYYLNRSWAIRTSTAKSRVRLFFNEEELQDLAINAGVTIIDTNTISVKRYTGPDAEQEFFLEGGNITEFTFNLFNTTDFIWEVSFIEENFDPNTYVQYYIELSNPEDDPTTSTYDPEEVADSRFYLIENPVMDWVQLEAEDFYHVGSGQMKIVNAAGLDVHLSTFDNRIIESEKINVSDLPSGVYFFVLEYSDIQFSKTFKFIKI